MRILKRAALIAFYLFMSWVCFGLAIDAWSASNEPVQAWGSQWVFRAIAIVLAAGPWLIIGTLIFSAWKHRKTPTSCQGDNHD